MPLNRCVLNKTVGVRFCASWGSVMWVLPEEVRVRRAVGEGISRALPDTYQTSDSIPAPLGELLMRLEQGREINRHTVSNGLAEAT